MLGNSFAGKVNIKASLFKMKSLAKVPPYNFSMNSPKSYLPPTSLSPTLFIAELHLSHLRLGRGIPSFSCIFLQSDLVQRYTWIVNFLLIIIS